MSRPKPEPLPKRTISEREATFPLDGELRFRVESAEARYSNGYPFIVIRVGSTSTKIYELGRWGWEYTMMRNQEVYRCTRTGIPSSRIEALRVALAWYFTFTREQLLNFLTRQEEGNG